jgi:hypothetical protein
VERSDVIHDRFCKNVRRIPRFSVNGVAELEMNTGSRRGKVLCLVVKYWPRILQMEKEEIVRGCHD